jgi:hypothetical protein
MKTIAIESESRPVAEWLPAKDTEVVYLTRGGKAKYVLIPLDEGDEEALAIKNNQQLMDYVTACIERARNGPTKSLAEIRAELNVEAPSTPANRSKPISSRKKRATKALPRKTTSPSARKTSVRTPGRTRKAGGR